MEQLGDKPVKRNGILFKITGLVILVCVLISIIHHYNSLSGMLKRLDRSTDCSKGIDLCNKILEKDPNNAEVYFKRGQFKEIQLGRLYNTRSLISIYEVQNITEDYDMAIRYDPQNSRYLERNAKTNEEYRQYQKAVDNYTKLAKLNYEYFTNLQKKFFSLSGSKMERYPAYYIIFYTYEILKGNENSSNHESLAYSYYHAGDYNHAIIEADKAIELDPNNGNPYFVRGDVNWNTGKYQIAINDYNRGRRLAPDYPHKTQEQAYQEIDPYDFEVKYRNLDYSIDRKNILKFKSNVTYSFNDGPTYFFKSIQGDTDLVLYSPERINNLWRGKRLLVYYTHDPNLSYSERNKIDAYLF